MTAKITSLIPTTPEELLHLRCALMYHIIGMKTDLALIDQNDQKYKIAKKRIDDVYDILKKLDHFKQ